MAETDDRDSRTEEATEKRISEAIEKGNVPTAREATLFGSIIAILAALMLLGGWSVMRLVLALRTVMGSVGALRLDDREAAASFLAALLVAVAGAVLPIMAVIAAGSIIASVVQSPPSWAVERIMPQASRISLQSGVGKLFGKAGTVEFVKSVIKLLVVLGITWFMLRSELGMFVASLESDPSMLLQTLNGSAVRILSALAGFAGILAVADFVWSRLKWRKDLRMTRHEVKEEMKQAEGDPLMKARIRNIGRQRASRRMLEKLPGASMVIANPTHYAVALRYSREEGGAPQVVAKGVDFMALKIREIAAEHEVPVVENKPLARALYDKVEIDTQIPPEFYRAIAEIIHFLHSRGRLPKRPPAG